MSEEEKDRVRLVIENEKLRKKCFRNKTALAEKDEEIAKLKERRLSWTEEGYKKSLDACENALALCVDALKQCRDKLRNYDPTGGSLDYDLFPGDEALSAAEPFVEKERRPG